tara:strand:- start:252 stop:1085 length:834 start_codon:yes stop_codon:yes gene_type:complete
LNLRFIYIKFLHVVLLLILFTNCKKPGCTDPVATNYNSKADVSDSSCLYDTNSLKNLTLNVYHYFDSSEFSFDSIYHDDFGNKIQLIRASFYMGNTKFKNSNGELIENSENYVLISPENNSYNLGSIYSSNFSSIDVLIGIDSITNHLDPATYQNSNPLSYQSPSMHWQMGINPSDWSYLFVVIEGKVDIDGNNSFDSGEIFVFHLGGDNFISNTNNIECELTQNQNTNYEISIDANWASIIDNINLSTDNFTHTMDNIPLANIISENSKHIVSSHL